ncbi:MAG: methionine--tRNA ligase [Candidatus Micrarchaeota archaeon]
MFLNNQRQKNNHVHSEGIEIRYLITGALPTVNADIHFGGVVGCLLRPDIYKRFLKLKGEDVISICGSDEYGTPILVAAENEGLKPPQLCDKYHKIHKEAIEALNIRFDNFGRTTSLEHTKVVQDFYYQLKQNNYIYRKEIEQLYCEKCARSLADRYVKGTCPHCGNADALGDQCEKCGKALEPTELIEPKCAVCGSKPVKKNVEHVFFELSKLREPLLEWVEQQTHWPTNARNFALNWLRGELRDKDISRDIQWGVPIPDAPGQVFYVWFDAPIGYITFTKQIGKENWWRDKNTRIVHFLGKDNIPFHTIFFPGMLKAAGGFTPPYQVSASEWLNYEGGKFSKSAGRGIFVTDAQSLGYPADYWRYYLTSVLPEKQDSDFGWDDFQSKVNNDLNDQIGNFVHRTLTFTKNFFGSKVPELNQEDLLAQDRTALAKIDELVDRCGEELAEIELKKSLSTAVEIARLGNQYLTKEEPWKNQNRKPAVIYVCLNVVKALSVALEPFIPESASKIRVFLGTDITNWDDAKQRLINGASINDFSPLFKKIEAKEINELKKKFGSKEELGAAASKKGAQKHDKKGSVQMKKQTTAVQISQPALGAAKNGGKPMIKYDDFEKLELKIGTIKSAEKVEGADKLVKLAVDTGEPELRTLVAGIAKHYGTEELINKKIVVLVNLEPRKLKGIESQGMLLAAEGGDGNVALLTVDKDEVGSGANVD